MTFPYRKILILGNGGAGKSTFAADMGRAFSLPVVHLDRLWWLPGWVNRTQEEFDALLCRELAKPAWVMDGNYHRTLALRLAAADAAVFLDIPAAECLRSARLRAEQYAGRTRPDMADGCPERVDAEFEAFIDRYSSETGNPITCNPVEDYPLDVTVTMEPIQEGTGDPSPDNVRPISGRSSVKVTVSNEDESHDYTLTMPETIYGGEVGAVSGVGSKEWEYYEFTGEESWIKATDNLTNVYRYYYTPAVPQERGTALEGYCNIYKTLSSGVANETGVLFGYSNANIYLHLPKSDYPDAKSVKSYLAAQYSAGTPITICYKLATPEPFQATGNQPIPALTGENTVYTDADTLTVSGRTDPLSTIQTMQAQITALQDQVTQGGTA